MLRADNGSASSGEKRAMPLETVATRTNLSIGFLGQIEHGLHAFAAGAGDLCGCPQRGHRRIVRRRTSDAAPEGIVTCERKRTKLTWHGKRNFANRMLWNICFISRLNICFISRLDDDCLYLLSLAANDVAVSVHLGTCRKE